MFIVYYHFGPYDSDSSRLVFSSLQKAVVYCRSKLENNGMHPKNPFKDDPHGWVIEEHVVDDPDGIVKYYNGDGVIFHTSQGMSW